MYQRKALGFAKGSFRFLYRIAIITPIINVKEMSLDLLADLFGFYNVLLSKHQ